MNAPSGFQRVIEHFERNGWKFQVDQDRPVLRTAFRGKNGAVRCVVAIDESDDLIQAFAFLPIVPEHRSAAAVELCVRASYGTKIGNFEFDHNDGELRFQAAAPYAKGELNDDLIQRVLGTALVMADAFLPAFMKVIYANVSPAEAAADTHAQMPQSGEAMSAPELQTPPRLNLN